MTTQNHLEFLNSLGIMPSVVHSNLHPDRLEQHSIEGNMAIRSSIGAIAIQTGKFTGRSPEDRYIVRDSYTKDVLWWGNINKPFSSKHYNLLKQDLSEYLNVKEVYVRDAYAGSHPAYRMPIRVVNEYPWSNQFAYNMFLRPTEEELRTFSHEWTILNAPGFLADPNKHGTRQENFAVLNFTEKYILIGGTGYTGEIKKGIFSALNFILPFEKNVLSMHCSANVGVEGDTAIFFGLSGTGKTTLSADPDRKLIGDDEHGWCADNTIFNFEGGCYAKVIDLSEEKEPEIYRAIKRHAILENVLMDKNGDVDFADTSLTQNTRVSYPIDHIANIQPGSLAKNPKNIFFLTADAYGVLPPISKLNANQAAYHFISGYTAKVAGTEEGITEPKAVFSACFGAPFMPLHPTYYANMLSEKMEAAGVNVWLINTGWVGGAYGTGNRIKLKYTRSMISSALLGELDQVDYEEHNIFGLMMPMQCPNVPDELLHPKNTWADKDQYDRQAIILAKKFEENFKTFEDQASPEILKGSPNLYVSAN
jgi:phosphoenolpyruvate carboxykinase (ATP)